MRDAVVVRPARPEDVPAIAGLSAAFAAEDLLVARTPDQLRDLLREFLAATSAGRLVGCVGLSQREHEVLLYNFCVVPDLHGLGIGGLLLDHAAAVASVLGCRSLVAASKHTGGWFLRHGFTEIGPRHGLSDPAALLVPGRGSRLYRRPAPGRRPGHHHSVFTTIAQGAPKQ
ncbi:GNAT family N-acetyltransferase [Kitasatospora xanthocidica]|uniref:GNAT family N-acetyltransferase n=1 Tax=Kitasatospora xanthocidica TaxID=83382 RepID=UPI0036E4A034